MKWVIILLVIVLGIFVYALIKTASDYDDAYMNDDANDNNE